MFGLIVPQPHLSDITEGRASWDRRAFSTRKRGRIGLVDSDKKEVVAFADLVDVRRTSYTEFLEEFGGHRVNADMWAHYRSYYEFTLRRVVPLKKGMRIDLRDETVWVELPDDAEDGKSQASILDYVE